LCFRKLPKKAADFIKPGENNCVNTVIGGHSRSLAEMLHRMNAHTALTRTLAHAAPPRAVGGLHLSVSFDRGRSNIRNLRQSGSLKALFPRPDGPALPAVMLNTAGGLTGGDRMQVSVAVEPDAHVILSSQAAERAYRAKGQSRAEVTVALRAGPRARIDWLPQETILFDGAALDRRLLADLAPDAKLLLVEPLIFGRVAMGEVVRHGSLHDHWQVRRDGQLVFADALRLDGDIAADLARKGVAGGAGAMASVLYVGPDASAFVTQLRLLLPATAGCSLIRDGVLFARMLARDGFDLRRSLIAVIEYLGGAPLPKVWRL
jgi:urease accessory protein